MTLKRDLVKYVRDKAKSKYNKGTECYICGSQENLDFHHFYGLTELLEVWLKKEQNNHNFRRRNFRCSRKIYTRRTRKNFMTMLLHYVIATI